MYQKNIQCDFCKKSFTEADEIELLEFHYIRFTGGYASVFGDGTEVECDICQRCLKEIIKDKYRIVTGKYMGGL
jgi:hypothetical protein